MSKINRSQDQLADQSLFDGISKSPQTFPLVMMGGKPVTPAEVTAALQARLDSNRRALSTRAAWQAAVKADLDEREKSRALVTAVRSALQAAFAESPEMLAGYGLKPRKEAVVSPETRVAAAVKARATRAARHTMGSNQKKQVKGNVTGVTVTPLTPAPKAETPAANGPTPASPAPAPTPAPAGTPQGPNPPR
jgi:hypothetical protein